MNDIEKVIKDLVTLEDTYERIGNPIVASLMRNTIHAIRELQELNKGLSESYTSNPMYEIGYKKGASDMEKAKQIIIDKLQSQIPKWHLCSEELPNESGKYIVATTNGRVTIYGFTTDAYRLDRYDFHKYKGQKKALFYGYDSEWGYSECSHVIAWTELPKFEGVE